jgi:hypothetical protein
MSHLPNPTFSIGFEELRPHVVSGFACCLLHAGFVVGLLLNLEDRGYVSLRMSVDF